jgi:hypothetical protein
MSDSKMQDEFEAAIAAESGESITAVVLSRKGETYATSVLHFAWWAWQASRAALVIELPSQHDEKYQEYFDDVEGGCFNSGKYLGDVRAAIEAAGVRVRT